MATKWACAGPGKITWDFFMAIKNCLPTEDHEFVAVASRDLARAQKFAEEFKFKKAYGSYDELANDKDIDDNMLHMLKRLSTLEQYTSHMQSYPSKCWKLGNMLSEKPMAMNLKDAKKVFEAARKNKRIFIEAIWSRWLPAYRQIMKEVDAGTLGDINLLQASFCVPIAGVERLKNAKLGGGGLLDIGIYVINLACMVFKEMPDSITAVGQLSEAGDVDVGGCIVLKYKNGAMANLTYHINAGQGNTTACIMGTKGMIEVPAPFYCADKVTTPSGTHEFPAEPGNYNFVKCSGLAFEATAMRETILSGKLENEFCTLADSEMIMTIMDEVRRQIGMKYPDFD